jgi:NADPH2:quinone reductase
LRAAVLPALGGQFELREVPEPEGEVLVRVRAAGVNFADVLVRRGRYPQMPELPAILGSEIAGELEDGTRVMALTAGGGGYAELAAVERAALVPLPEGATFAEGAAFLLAFLTAYIPLSRQVRLREGATVLVYAAAGGVGTAAIQVARALGASVVAAAGARDKLDVCRELGAEEAYVYDELPSGLAADIVLDPVGGELSSLSARRRAPGRRSTRRVSWAVTQGCRASTSGGCCGSRPRSSARRSRSCSSSGGPARCGRSSATSSRSRA